MRHARRLPLTGPRCTDPDDQKFLDLALHAHAKWLVSRDKALLRLARKARPLGLERTDLPGYGTQAAGHLQVASAVAAGLADVGVASEPAARTRTAVMLLNRIAGATDRR